MRVFYALGHYVSHRNAGEAYRRCLSGMGVELVDNPTRADVAVLHNEPWSLASYYRAWPVLKEKHVVAYSVWETDRLPPHYAFNLALVDEIWTASRYCQGVLSQAGPPVHVVPHVVERCKSDKAAHAKLAERLGPPDDRLVFYTIGAISNCRKAIDVVVRAFDGLFPPDEAQLVVKCDRPLPARLAQVPGVRQILGPLAPTEIAALHERGQVFVSAHRSEGWGLGISEAMLHGNLAIATGHGGNLDFMSADNSILVPARTERIRQDDLKRSGLLSADMQWGYIDEDALRSALRRCRQQWDELTTRRMQAQLDMEAYSSAAVARVLAQRMRQGGDT